MTTRRSPFRPGWLSLALALHAILLLFLTATAAGWWLVERSNGSTASDGSPAPIYPTVIERLGTNVALEQYAEAELAEVLDELRAANLRWLRQSFPWADIEPVRGDYRWSQWDRIVEAVSSRDLNLIAVLDTSPAWARSEADAGKRSAPPHERSDFGRFAAAFARRYGGGINYYQIWDEPNIAPHWGARGADPADYLGLLREGYVQLKAADEESFVLLAGLAPTVEEGGANLSDLLYLQRLYRVGAAEWFDIAAAKPYGFDFSPTDQRPDHAVLNWPRLALLRDVMEANADEDTPLWAVEFGWNSLPEGWTGAPSIWGQVDEITQAQYLAAAYDNATRDWPWLGLMLWASYQPQAPSHDAHWGFALVDAAGQPRPVWSQIRSLATDSAPLPPGVYAADHPALHYTGGWRVTPTAADIGADGDELAFQFWGTRLDLEVQRGAYWAYLTVEVDGQPANALPSTTEGSAYVVLHDPLGASERVVLARDLADGPHSARIIAQGGWGQWAIRRVIVSREPNSRYRPWMAVLLVLGVLTIWNGLRLARRAEIQEGFVAWLDWIDNFAGRLRLLPEWGQVGLVLASAAVFAFSRWTAVDVLSLAILVLVLALRLDLVLPLIALAIPFFLRPKVLLDYQFSHVEIFTVVGITLLICRSADRACRHALSRKGPSRSKVAILRLPRRLTLDWPVVTLVAVSALSLAVAHQKGVALREFRVVIAESALFYLLVSRLQRHHTRPFSPWPVIDGLTLGGLAVSLVGLTQLVTAEGRVEVEGVWRITALYGSPNNLGLYLERLLPVLAAIACFGKTRWRRWAYGLLLIPIGLACLFTFSKGALLLGLPASVLFLGAAGSIAAHGRRKLVPFSAAVAVLLVVGIALIPLFGTERFGGLFDLSSGTSFIRLQLWRGALKMATDHPLLGVGLDNFLYAYRTRYVLPSAWEELNLSHPHNILLDLWTRLGLLGLASGIWLLVAGFRASWRAWREAEDSDHAALLLGLLASLVATVTHGLIDNSLFLVDLAFVFMLTLGIIRRQQYPRKKP